MVRENSGRRGGSDLEVQQTTVWNSKAVIIFWERLHLRQFLLTYTGVCRTLNPLLVADLEDHVSVLRSLLNWKAPSKFTNNYRKKVERIIDIR